MPSAQFVEQRFQIAGAHCGQIEDPAALSYLSCQLFFRHRIEQAEDLHQGIARPAIGSLIFHAGGLFKT
jgi:hypothetical protein